MLHGSCQVTGEAMAAVTVPPRPSTRTPPMATVLAAILAGLRFIGSTPVDQVLTDGFSVVCRSQFPDACGPGISVSVPQALGFPAAWPVMRHKSVNRRNSRRAKGPRSIESGPFAVSLLGWSARTVFIASQLR